MLRFLFSFILTVAVALSLSVPALPGEHAVAENSQTVEIETYPSPIGGFEKLMQAISYPESAKKSGTSGKVLLKLFFNDQGQIEKTEVAESLSKEFDDAAIKAVKAVQWKPAMTDGKPVACEIMLPIQFKLDEKKK